MRQPHKNLFFAYRGPAAQEDASFEHLERQLEDNVTRALIYVLEHADRSVVLRPFLHELLGSSSSIALNEVQFALQRVDIARPTVAQRLAIAIAPEGELHPGDPKSHVSGRPDAWIWLDDVFSVLIEVKARGKANRAQIERHIEGAEGWEGKPIGRRVLRWDDVYRLLLRIHLESVTSDTLTRRLLSEFLEYLRMTGLSGDTTFDLHDFGYFLLDKRDREPAVRALLARKLQRFTEHFIETPVIQAVLKQYGVKANSKQFVKPGVFRRESVNYWITISPKERQERCHFTLRLSEDGISLEVFSPHLSFTKPLVRRIASAPQAFVDSLAPLRERDGYFFRLREAYYENPSSSYKGQRIGRRVDFLHIDPRVLTATNVGSFIVEPVRRRFNDPRLRPEIFLVRHFGLSQLVGKSDVVSQLAASAEPMLPYLEYALQVA